MTQRSRAAGMTLIELLIGISVGAIVLGALGAIVRLGVDAQTAGRQQNELFYQGSFAFERMITKARAVSPKQITNPTAGTTGNWFAPTGCVGAACVMYCRNASNQLIETVTTDITCTGTTVIARNVTAFSAVIVTATTPVNRPTGSLTLTMSHANAPQTVTLSTSFRLGGGTL